MPVSVGRPTAAANSATQNSATSGAPGPATASGCSPWRLKQRRVVDRLGWVQVGPGDRVPEQLGFGGVRGGPADAAARAPRSAVSRVAASCGHGSIQSNMCSIQEWNQSTIPLGRRAFRSMCSPGWRRFRDGCCATSSTTGNAAGGELPASPRRPPRRCAFLPLTTRSRHLHLVEVAERLLRNLLNHRSNPEVATPPESPTLRLHRDLHRPPSHARNMDTVETTIPGATTLDVARTPVVMDQLRAMLRRAVLRHPQAPGPGGHRVGPGRHDRQRTAGDHPAALVFASFLTKGLLTVAFRGGCSGSSTARRPRPR